MSGDNQRSLVVVRGAREKNVRQVATADCVCRWSASPDGRRIRIGLTVGVGEPPSGWKYVALFPRVRLDDCGVVATELVPGDEVLSAAVDVGERTSGWFVGDMGGGELLVRTVEVVAVVEVPRDADAIRVNVRLDASMVLRSLFSTAPRRLRHARLDHPWRFRKTVRADTARPVMSLDTSSRLPVAPSFVRLCFALDIENYSRFHDVDAVRAQERLLDVVSRVQARAGVAVYAFDTQSSGDGLFVVLPPGVDETFAVPEIVNGLVDALGELNRNLDDHTRLRLRLALHRGAIRPSRNGWVGNAVIAVHRLLDARILRTTLRHARHADLALIVPDMLFRDIIVHGCQNLSPAGFRSTTVDVPDKSFSEQAWIHVPVRNAGSGARCGTGYDPVGGDPW